MNKGLSILAFEDNEKPAEYLEFYFASLAEWNRDGLADCELYLITQKRPGQSMARTIAKKNNLKINLVEAENAFIDGRPVWDVMASIRKVWPALQGTYFTCNHTEFIWGPGRLKKTIAWLNKNGHHLVLGNLRRPATEYDTKMIATPEWRPGNCSKEISDGLVRMMRRRAWSEAAKYFEKMTTVYWPLWKRNPLLIAPGPCEWHEDCFFARVDWMDAWRGIEHGGEQPFQDIYDLMRYGLVELHSRNLDPQTFRMDGATNKIIHIWHKKEYQQYTPGMRDWFLSNPKRWSGTPFLNERLWTRLFTLNTDSIRGGDQFAKYDLRRLPGGTITRYTNELNSFLNNGGRQELTAFYSLSKGGKRSRL